jgi:MoxR-like ATPase
MTPSQRVSASSKFEPKDIERRGGTTSEVGDQRGGGLYVYSPNVKLAVKVALATGRPLLVRGAPGWGKSSLAGAVAKVLGWRYLEKVISSRTQARDLLSELDLIRRLSDAQGVGKVDPDWRRYIRPGVLWRAFDPAGAERQQEFFERREAAPEKTKQKADKVMPAVVLLDEMDKADPDVPNNLLVALGSLQFDVEEIGPPTIKADPNAIPLIIVTTNDERDLPRAFLRRCVEIELPALNEPDPEEQRKKLLIDIGALHLEGKLDREFVTKVADTIVDEMKRARPDGVALLPSPAEFIDTLRALYDLYGTAAKTDDIVAITRIAARKLGLIGSG